MAGTIQVRCGFNLINGNVAFKAPIEGFNATQSTAKGPIIGVVAIPTTAGGTAISLTALATPGWAWAMNQDATNYVSIGLIVSAAFYPMIELLPGQAVPIPLSRTLNNLAALANTATVNLAFYAFDK